MPLRAVHRPLPEVHRSSPPPLCLPGPRWRTAPAPEATRPYPITENPLPRSRPDTRGGVTRTALPLPVPRHPPLGQGPNGGHPDPSASPPRSRTRLHRRPSPTGCTTPAPTGLWGWRGVGGRGGANRTFFLARLPHVRENPIRPSHVYQYQGRG